jgi:hypothetical protein
MELGLTYNNMTHIQPITIPTKGEGTLFQISALNFPMNPTSVTFYWQVLSVTLDSYTSVLEGNLSMDAETYSQWNNDDNFVINWACNLLNFVII